MCPEWKPQQKILWAEVSKENGRRESRWMIQDLLSATNVGRLVPAEEGAGSGASEWELRKRREREEERRVEAEELDAFLFCHTRM